MSRILFWIILFGAGYWFWRRAKTAAMQAAARGGAAGRAGGGAAADVPKLAEPMVRCGYCGAHSPSSDTVALYRLHFCNAEHARLYASGERKNDAS